jgi:hypothetical protein
LAGPEAVPSEFSFQPAVSLVKTLTEFHKAAATVLCLGIVFALAATASAQAPEYQIKAAMLYNFALFIEWPAQKLASDVSPFAVCVLGKDPFGPWLKYEFGDQLVGGHPVEIRYTETASQSRGCHILFISPFEQRRIQQILADLQNASILTVSDVKDVEHFCREGGMIAFVMEDNKVRFHLNSRAMDEAGLKTDSRLKRIALSANCGEAR